MTKYISFRLTEKQKEIVGELTKKRLLRLVKIEKKLLSIKETSKTKDSIITIVDMLLNNQ